LLGECLIPDAGRRGRCREVRVEADIGRVRQMPRQAAFGATHIQNLLPRSNNPGNMLEFGSGETRSRQYALEIPVPMKLAIKELVARQHRLEEG